MSEKMDIPRTFSQRFSAYLEEKPKFRDPKSPEWFTKEANDKIREKLFNEVAYPYDARFPQARRQRQCFVYYTDYFRCKELLGESYEPCNFFKSVYEEVCPKIWTQKWDEYREQGTFPANLKE